MFSLHIDTARSWRGGQSQVMYTVLGLRLLDQRAALVAHPEGELFKRMSEGLDLIPLAPMHEIDLAAAWRLSRVIRQLRPDIVQAHDPHAVAMAATALSISSPKPQAAARRVAPGRVPHRAQFVFALEVRPGGLLHRQLRGDPRPPRRPTASRARRRRSSTRAWTSSASSRCRRPTCTPSSTCRRTPRSSATSRRSCRTRASST